MSEIVERELPRRERDPATERPPNQPLFAGHDARAIRNAFAGRALVARANRPGAFAQAQNDLRLLPSDRAPDICGCDACRLAHEAEGRDRGRRSHVFDALRCLADSATRGVPDGGLGELAPATRRRLAAELGAPASAAFLRADEREAAVAFFARDPDDPSDLDAWLRASAALLAARRPDFDVDAALADATRGEIGQRDAVLRRVAREGIRLPAVALWKLLAVTAAPGEPIFDSGVHVGHGFVNELVYLDEGDGEDDDDRVLPLGRVREIHACRAARDPDAFALAALPPCRRADADFVLAAAGIVPDDVRAPDALDSPYRFVRVLGGDARALAHADDALWLEDARFARAVFGADPRVAATRRAVALVLRKGRAAGPRLAALSAPETGRGLAARVFAFCATAESYARDAAWTPWPRACATPRADTEETSEEPPHAPPPPKLVAATTDDGFPRLN